MILRWEGIFVYASDNPFVFADPQGLRKVNDLLDKLKGGLEHFKDALEQYKRNLKILKGLMDVAAWRDKLLGGNLLEDTKYSNLTKNLIDDAGKVLKPVTYGLDAIDVIDLARNPSLENANKVYLDGVALVPEVGPYLSVGIGALQGAEAMVIKVGDWAAGLAFGRDNVDNGWLYIRDLPSKVVNGLAEIGDEDYLP
jgi:hypothetical protein